MSHEWFDDVQSRKLNKRYNLAINRIREIASEQEVPAIFAPFFLRTAKFIILMDNVKAKLECGFFKNEPEEMRRLNKEIYQDILPEHYDLSYANPTYAVHSLGSEMGRLLCFLYAQERGLTAYIFEGKLEEAVAHMELFIQVYCIAAHESKEGMARSVRKALYWFESDYTDVILSHRIREALDPSRDFAQKILMESNLDDLNYLYKYGEYITDSEIILAQHLNSLPREEISKMAETIAEGFRMGFVNARKPLEKKKSVNLRYHVGFERVAREVVLNFSKMGLGTTIYRYAVSAMAINGAYRNGFTGAFANRQYDYDHREDAALMLDEKFAARKIDVVRRSYENLKKEAEEHAGPAIIETFGEKPFESANKSEAWRYDERQRKLQIRLSGRLSQISNEFIIGKERSFTIISFPIPEIALRDSGTRIRTGHDEQSEDQSDEQSQIGPQAESRRVVSRANTSSRENNYFTEPTCIGRLIDRELYARIFHDIIRVNTLDVPTYLRIQAVLIGALNKGTHVRILGANGNRTDLIVRLCRLNDPDKESVFENCGADVNIPVGEVFTSPVLRGTNGVLHVSQVYLNGLNFKNLEIHFKDGMTTEYSCENFKKREDNETYIYDNILMHHESLPMGEFAIGTNTTAYAVARKYHIEGCLPILIAEKTGPHFAVGDTCYSREEDSPVFNPDGKEVIARDNEVSCLRKIDQSKAYFDCHTDITIPYDELGLIEAIGERSYRQTIISNGRFTLPGTERLNIAFE